MKKIIAFSVLIFCITFGFAQKYSDCKFEVDDIDAKTGKPVKEIKVKLTGTDVFYIIVSRQDTAYKLTLNFWIAGALKATISKNDTISIKLSGGQYLLLQPNAVVRPVPHYSDQTWSEYSPEFSISSTDVARLRTTVPLNINLQVGYEKVYREFNTKDTDKIKDMIKCIMK